jgi:hypothetical protein
MKPSVENDCSNLQDSGLTPEIIDDRSKLTDLSGLAQRRKIQSFAIYRRLSNGA